MTPSELLTELFDRIPPLVRSAVEGLGPERLVATPAPGTNSVGWLVWHLTRVQDDHVAELLGEQQLWVSGEWAERFGLEADPSNTGYGHSTEDVATVRPEGWQVLVAYHEAVAARTQTMLQDLSPEDLDRVVDEAWDPPVTLGVRLVSVADDDLQHAGQAAYVRGMLAEE